MGYENGGLFGLLDQSLSSSLTASQFGIEVGEGLIQEQYIGINR